MVFSRWSRVRTYPEPALRNRLEIPNRIIRKFHRAQRITLTEIESNLNRTPERGPNFSIRFCPGAGTDRMIRSAFRNRPSRAARSGVVRGCMGVAIQSPKSAERGRIRRAPAGFSGGRGSARAVRLPLGSAAGDPTPNSALDARQVHMAHGPASGRRVRRLFRLIFYREHGRDPS
jgi:hypothetical protein